MATNGGSSSSNPTGMVTFINSDGEKVEVPVEIARKFGRVREFFDGDLDRPEVENAAPFPLSKVDRWSFNLMVAFHKLTFPLSLEFEELEKERLVDLPSKYQALERKRVLLRSKYQALMKKRQKVEEEIFGQQSDETIVELVKAADFLEDKELLDSVMPSFRMRFGLGDDKGVDFVYKTEFETILLWRAASTSWGADEDGDNLVFG